MGANKKVKKFFFYTSRLWQIENALIINDQLIKNNNCFSEILIEKKIEEIKNLVFPKNVSHKIIYKKNEDIGKLNYFINFFHNLFDKNTTTENIIFIDKWSGINIEILIRLSKYYNLKVVLYQHGENYLNNKIFSWKKGWKELSFLNIIRFSFKPYLYSLLYLLNPFNKTSIKINFKNIYLFRNKFFFADKILLIHKNAISKNFSNKFEIVGSLLTERIDKKNFYNEGNNKKICLYSLGIGKVPQKVINKRQDRLVNYVYNYCEKFNCELFIKLKPGEKRLYDFYKNKYDNIKLITELADNLNFKLFILPCDSASTIEMSYLSKDYFTFNLYENYGYIGSLNKKNKIPEISFVKNRKQFFRDFNKLFDDQKKSKLIHTHLNLNNTSKKIANSLINL